MQEKSSTTYGNFQTSSHDPEAHEKVMKALKSKENDTWVEDYYRRHEKIERMVVEKYYPDHIDHTQEEVDAESMYGLFLFKTMKCSCGAKFDLERDMYVLDEKMEERLR